MALHCKPENYDDESSFLLIDTISDVTVREELRHIISAIAEPVARLRVLGHALLDLGLDCLALNAFGGALMLDDLDAATHLGLTRTYLKSGRTQVAIEHLKIAISLAPEADDLRVLAADLIAGESKLKALDQLAVVLKSDPDHLGARKVLSGLIRTAVGHC